MEWRVDTDVGGNVERSVAQPHAQKHDLNINRPTLRDRHLSRENTGRHVSLHERGDLSQIVSQTG